jgi:nucleoside phosphorylase
VSRILVTFALRAEGAAFEGRLTGRVSNGGQMVGSLDSQEIAVSWLGIGVRNRPQFDDILTKLGPDLVINSGFAGAVRTLLEPGDFVLAENFSSPDLLKRLETVRVFEAKGKFACVDAVADPAAKMRINSQGNFLALEMESAHVAAICQKFSVPLVSARMISDRYDEAVPGIFLGRPVRRTKDISDAIAFASRMIVLRHRLADRLTELIRALTREPSPT